MAKLTKKTWEKEFNKVFKKQFGNVDSISLADFRAFVWEIYKCGTHKDGIEVLNN